MVSLLNRKELAITFSMAEQSRIRTVLADNGIKYQIKTVSRLGGQRGQTLGTSKEDLEYIIYVHKNEFERAQSVL